MICLFFLVFTGCRAGRGVFVELEGFARKMTFERFCQHAILLPNKHLVLKMSNLCY